MGKPLQSFFNLQGLETRQPLYKKTHKDLNEVNYVWPHLDIFGFPGKNKNYSLHKKDCCNVTTAAVGLFTRLGMLKIFFIRMLSRPLWRPRWESSMCSDVNCGHFPACT